MPGQGFGDDFGLLAFGLGVGIVAAAIPETHPAVYQRAGGGFYDHYPTPTRDIQNKIDKEIMEIMSIIMGSEILN